MRFRRFWWDFGDSDEILKILLRFWRFRGFCYDSKILMKFKALERFQRLWRNEDLKTRSHKQRKTYCRHYSLLQPRMFVRGYRMEIAELEKLSTSATAQESVLFVAWLSRPIWIGYAMNTICVYFSKDLSTGASLDHIISRWTFFSITRFLMQFLRDVRRNFALLI